MFVCVFVSSYRLNFRAPLVNFVMRWHNFTVDRIIQYVSRKRKRINISLIAIDEWFIFVLATVYLEWLLQHRPLHQIILWTKWQVVWLRHCHLHFLQMDFFENWLKFHWRFFQWLKWHWISIGWSIWASARPNQWWPYLLTRICHKTEKNAKVTSGMASYWFIVSNFENLLESLLMIMIWESSKFNTTTWVMDSLQSGPIMPNGRP